MVKLTEFSMKNVAAVVIIMILLFAGGIYSAGTLKVESMPDISFPVVLVSTQYPAPPKDVLEQITKPLEKQIATMEGIKNLTSTSNDNYSQIIIELDQGNKPEDVKRDVESLISNVQLPDDAEKPKVMTFGFATEPVYYMAVYGQNGMNQAELDKIYKDVIEPGFNSIKGIDHIDSIGNKETKVEIKLDANALQNYGLTPTQVINAVKANLTSSPAGSVDFNGNTEMVRVTGEFNSIYNLDNMEFTAPSGDTLLLNQIGKVESISESTFFARLDGKPAIAIHLYKTKDANAVEFGNAADKLIKEWKTTLPNIAFHTVYNGATDILESVNGMIREGGLGAILASLMILFFLRNFRMTLIVLISIPLSILITLLLMAPLNISINIMTLGGMAIAVGRVVDDSIVVIENIYSQLLKAQERNESVIKLAVEQVASAITSSTLTTVGVFGPIGFVSGVVGEVFRPFAITLAAALISSLFVALTVIPMLSKLMVMNSRSIPEHGTAQVSKMSAAYKSILLWSLKHRVKTVLLAGLLFVLSFVLIVPNLAVSFMPDSETDKQIMFQIHLPRETSIETMDAQMKQIEALLRDSKDPAGHALFTYVESLVGYDFTGSRSPYKATLFSAVSETANAKETMNAYKEKMLAQLPKNSTVNAQLLSFNEGGSSGTDFSYSLKGDDQLALQEAAGIIEEKMKEFPVLTDVKDSLGDSKMEVEVTVNQNEAKLYGLTVGQVLGAIHDWIKDESLGDIKFDNVLLTTTIGLDSDFKNSIQKIGEIPLSTPTGATIHVQDIAKVRNIEAPVSITREKQQQVVKVAANIDSPDKGGVSQRVSKALDAIPLPVGVSREVAGVTRDINDSFSQMFLAMAASIFIVYLIMVLAFGNASAPFAILFSLPLAAIGGLVGLLVTSQSLNVTSLIGFLMLIGIVVTNAIVLVDRVQQLREQGYSVRDSLIEAGMTRLRPIIMTAGATIFALLPLALGFSKGTLISKGLAVVVIGGLTTSTLLTLVIVPIVYELIQSFKGRIKRLFNRKTSAEANSMMIDRF
ncbi:efflux RND transporter permease subunit [Ferviditalea candida]|uniref:Efflux RND transporter permease subunit n=1 Tax=Ferviditalea candida TaxID=3108399 RepID=A0ABU5ZK29_9BACL|nr:efflux RND transporter permease subunit [Paenibacillaceae bacterium T2]